MTYEVLTREILVNSGDEVEETSIRRVFYSTLTHFLQIQLEGLILTEP